MKMNEELKELLEKMKELEEGFEYEESERSGEVCCLIKDRWNNEILFYKDVMEAAAFIGVRNDDLEMVRKGFDANHELWENIFGDSAEDVEITEILDYETFLCKVRTEHGNTAILRVESYTNWEPEGFDGWPAWKVTPW